LTGCKYILNNPWEFGNQPCSASRPGPGLHDCVSIYNTWKQIKRCYHKRSSMANIQEQCLHSPLHRKVRTPLDSKTTLISRPNIIMFNNTPLVNAVQWTSSLQFPYYLPVWQ
jgi:hypothetical protein